MKDWHPWQLKKSKSWGPFWSYQLNSTANSAHFAWFLGKWAKFSSKTAPRILIFSIVLGAEYSFYVKSMHCYLCPPKSWHNNSFPGSVNRKSLLVLTAYCWLHLILQFNECSWKKDSHKFLSTFDERFSGISYHSVYPNKILESF